MNGEKPELGTGNARPSRCEVCGDQYFDGLIGCDDGLFRCLGCAEDDGFDDSGEAILA